MLEEIINRLGKDWTKEARDNFGFEDVKKFIDFYNNGGLEFHGSVNYALTYAAVKNDGTVKIGAWVWMRNEDFDRDASFAEYYEDDFSGGQLKKIYERINEIGQKTL